MFDNALHMVNADGSGLTRLGPAGVFDQDPAWSLARDRLAFGRNGGIHVMNADGSGLAQLTSGGGDKAPTWSPDGKQIAFSRQTDGSIWVMNADGTGQRRLISVPGVAWRMSWSPKGTRIAFSTYAQPGIWVVNRDGTALSKIHETGFSPSWGPHDLIAFAAESSPQNGDIHIMTSSGRGVVRLRGNSAQIDANPAWSADGSKLAFVSYRHGDWAIFTMRLNGSAVTRVTVGDTPSW